MAVATGLGTSTSTSTSMGAMGQGSTAMGGSGGTAGGMGVAAAASSSASSNSGRSQTPRVRPRTRTRTMQRTQKTMQTEANVFNQSHIQQAEMFKNLGKKISPLIPSLPVQFLKFALEGQTPQNIAETSAWLTTPQGQASQTTGSVGSSPIGTAIGKYGDPVVGQYGDTVPVKSKAKVGAAPPRAVAQSKAKAYKPKYPVGSADALQAQRTILTSTPFSSTGWYSSSQPTAIDDNLYKPYLGI